MGKGTGRHLLAAALALWLLIPGAVLPVLGAQCAAHGDINGDDRINLRDAIDLLRITALNVNPPRSYDINRDGSVDTDDALYILCYTLGGAFRTSCPLQGILHQYQPQWSWTDAGAVSVNLKCACGKAKTIALTCGWEESVQESDGAVLSVSLTQEESPTCGKAGSREYAASLTYDGTNYPSHYRVDLPATGKHTYLDGICQSCGMAMAQCSHICFPTGDNVPLDGAGLCTGQLQLHACPCGALREYTLETDCTQRSTPVGSFVEGTLQASQTTTEGLIWTASSACLLQCAEGHLPTRMCVYYLQEGCAAVEYQTWQLGYDSATGQCWKEITIPTGNRHTFHSYVSEEIHDGQVSGYQDVCSQCGSFYREIREYAGEAVVKEERSAGNTLSNGERKSWHEICIYDTLYHGRRFPTLRRCEWVCADGRECWEEDGYTYDFGAGCLKTTTHSDSSGANSQSTETAHTVADFQGNLQSPTCTQLGIYAESRVCDVCGTETDHYEEVIQPTGHRREWDDSKGCYVCAACGLESDADSIGSIVLEDFTSDTTDYVIGFWNRDNVEAIPCVQAVLDNQEIVTLEGVTFRELTRESHGIQGIAFPREEVWSDGVQEIRFFFAGNGWQSEDCIRFQNP